MTIKPKANLYPGDFILINGELAYINVHGNRILKLNQNVEIYGNPLTCKVCGSRIGWTNGYKNDIELQCEQCKISGKY
jgi:hypothetical protein